MSDSHIPAGCHAITPYLVVRGAAQAIEFYRHVFDAVEIFRLPMGEKIGHAELQIGNSRIMLADEFPDHDALAPAHFGGTPVSLLIYVPNVDEVFDRALAAGARLKRPLVDQFYGDRSGMVVDPFGHIWSIAMHQEDVSPKELLRRMSQGS